MSKASGNLELRGLGGSGAPDHKPYTLWLVALHPLVGRLIFHNPKLYGACPETTQEKSFGLTLCQANIGPETGPFRAWCPVSQSILLGLMLLKRDVLRMDEKVRDCREAPSVQTPWCPGLRLLGAGIGEGRLFLGEASRNNRPALCADGCRTLRTNVRLRNNIHGERLPGKQDTCNYGLLFRNYELLCGVAAFYFAHAIVEDCSGAERPSTISLDGPGENVGITPA